MVDLYDFGTNADKRVTISLNNSSPDNLSMGINSSHSYVVRAAGFCQTTNWFPFRRNQKPVNGWHRFRAVYSVSKVTATLDLNADGRIDRTVEIPLTTPPPKFTQLRFGGLTGRPSKGGPILVDNIRLEIVPVEPLPAVAAAPALNVSTTRVQDAPVTSTNAPVPQAAAGTWKLTVVFWWILGALSIIILLLFGMLLAIRRQGRTASSVALALPGGNTGSDPRLGSAEPAEWRNRALHAESLAAKQAKILQEKVGPELEEFAKQALVQGLYTQRNALLETQRKAHDALMELEMRLAELELPGPKRIEAYEKRIAELERELDSRDEEMRELTRATLLLVQQRLEVERNRGIGRFN